MKLSDFQNASASFRRRNPQVAGAGVLVLEPKPGRGGENKAAVERERALQDEIERYLRLHEITFCRARMDKRTTIRKGWPDFTFAIRGVPVALECKRPGEEPTADQVEVMAGLTRDGWRVRVVESLEETVAFLREIGLPIMY